MVFRKAQLTCSTTNRRPVDRLLLLELTIIVTVATRVLFIARRDVNVMRNPTSFSK